MDDIATLIFNIALHSIILFSFLSLFYWNYIIYKETEAISILIQDNLIDSIQEELEKHKMAKGIINKFNINDFKYKLHNRLILINEKQDDIYNNNHDKYKLLNLVILLALYIIFILIVNVLVYYKYKINYKDIIIENIVLIIIIGSIEAIFFNFIASQYVPLTDSDMNKMLINIINKI